MSITSITCRSAYTIGATVTTPLAIGFTYQVPTDVAVWKSAAGGPFLLILNSDYTLDGSGNVVPIAGGPGAVATGNVVTILRNTELTQLLDLTTNGLNNVANLSAAFDKLTQIVQQIKDAQARCLQLDIDDAAVTPFHKSARASKAVAFDSSGNLILQ